MSTLSSAAKAFISDVEAPGALDGFTATHADEAGVAANHGVVTFLEGSGATLADDGSAPARGPAAAKSVVSKVILYRVQKALWLHRCRQLVEERNAIAKQLADVAAADGDGDGDGDATSELQRKLAGVTVNIHAAQLELETCTEREQRAGLQKNRWLAKTARTGTSDKVTLRWTVSCLVKALLNLAQSTSTPSVDGSAAPGVPATGGVTNAAQDDAAAAAKAVLETERAQHRQALWDLDSRSSLRQLELEDKVAQLKQQVAELMMRGDTAAAVDVSAGAGADGADAAVDGADDVVSVQHLLRRNNELETLLQEQLQSVAALTQAAEANIGKHADAHTTISELRAANSALQQDLEATRSALNLVERAAAASAVAHHDAGAGDPGRLAAMSAAAVAEEQAADDDEEEVDETDAVVAVTDGGCADAAAPDDAAATVVPVGDGGVSKIQAAVETRGDDHHQDDSQNGDDDDVADDDDDDDDDAEELGEDFAVWEEITRACDNIKERYCSVTTGNTPGKPSTSRQDVLFSSMPPPPLPVSRLARSSSVGSEDEAEFQGRKALLSTVRPEEGAGTGAGAGAGAGAGGGFTPRATPRFRESVYTEKRGFGSSTARGMPDHLHRVEVRRRQMVGSSGSALTVDLPHMASFEDEAVTPTDSCSSGGSGHFTFAADATPLSKVGAGRRPRTVSVFDRLASTHTSSSRVKAKSTNRRTSIDGRQMPASLVVPACVEKDKENAVEDATANVSKKRLSAGGHTSKEATLAEAVQALDVTNRKRQRVQSAE